MSRMTKYLRQTCLVEKYTLDENGEVTMDRFGNIVYQDPVKCRCRHEVAYQEVLTTNGSIVKSTSRYFLDESVEILADYRIDGKPVLTVSTLVNENGGTEGFEVYV